MASIPFTFFFIAFLVLTLTGEVSALQEVMENEELLGLHEVMSSLLEDPDWAKLHPQPCTDTPWPGVECEVTQEYPTIFHVTKIHIGPDIISPPCKTKAKLSDSLLKLPYLKTLSIFNCFVSSPINLSPTLFGSLSSLEHLSLESNPSLSGEIPPCLSNISSLKVLSLSQNNLQGKIPKQLGGLISLEQLDLSYNNLTGQIPEEIGGFSSLTILDISWNLLEGEIPSSLSNLNLLQKIDLSSNKLIGTVPPTIGKLNRLVLLDLSYNFIMGPIPETLSGLDQLEYLLLDHNPINSTIPLFIGSLKSLTSISFSQCGLIGPIPNFSLNSSTLTALFLDNNNLSGTVPLSLGSLSNLDQLNLSYNQLSGELLFSEEFIHRVGKRLDVRGNGGLCSSTSNYMKKNVSLYNLGVSPCKEIGGNNESIFEKQNPEDSMGMEQPSWYNGRISSSSSVQWLHQKLVLSTFVVCWLSYYFLL